MVKHNLILFSALISCAAFGMEQKKEELVAAETVSQNIQLHKIIVKVLPYKCHARKSNLKDTCNINFPTRELLNRHLREKHGLQPKRITPRDCPGI